MRRTVNPKEHTIIATAHAARHHPPLQLDRALARLSKLPKCLASQFCRAAKRHHFAIQGSVPTIELLDP